MTPSNRQGVVSRIALVAACAIAALTHPLKAQVPHDDVASVQELLKRYNDQLERRPDSALRTLRAVLMSASREDSDDVSRYALIEGDRLFKVANAVPKLDSLSSHNLDTHIDSLGTVIQYFSLSDSVRSSSETKFFLYVSYFYRASTEAVLAQRTDNCNEWWAVHNDATLSEHYSGRSQSGSGSLLPPQTRRQSLLDYADGILRTRCDKGPKAAA
jgi:hypothetical protein